MIVGKGRGHATRVIALALAAGVVAALAASSSTASSRLSPAA